MVRIEIYRNGSKRIECHCGTSQVVWGQISYNTKCYKCGSEVPRIHAMKPGDYLKAYKIKWHRKSRFQ